MRFRAGAVLAVATCVVLCHQRTDVAAQPGAPRTVLMLHLGSEIFPSNPIIDAGVREAFAAHPEVPIAYYAEYLESDLFASQTATLAFKEYVARKYADRKIELVIASTDTVLRFALANRAELFPDAPIVFSALTAPDDRTRSEGAGVTGIRVGVAYVETLKLASALQPEVRQVFVIANGIDSPTSNAARDHLRGVAGITFTYLTAPSLPELLSSVRAIPPGSLLLYIWDGQFEPGRVIYADEVARLVARASPVPVYGTSDMYVGTGVVGGVVRSTRETGNRLGALALRILSGTAARDIPIETARVAPVVDWREIRRWNLAASRLPPGTQILFHEPSAWERYRGFLVATALAVIAEGVLIGALLVQRRRRKTADVALRRSYARVRDLGSRLLTAQEEERSRIARELHDDISQRLAVLKIDLTILSRSLAGEEAATASRTLARADEIADAVRDLSHRLHPSRLHLLGLGPAIAGLTADLARPGVNITFTQEGGSASLSHDVTVSLFRVAQEALQNALKYSQARVIAITLKGDETGVDLTIADDGVGFDVDAGMGGGLGLTSIRERVEAHAGTVEIRSAAGAGTRVHVRVPVAAVQSGVLPPVP